MIVLVVSESTFNDRGILKSVGRCYRLIQAFMNWYLVLKFLIVTTDAARWVFVIDQDEIFVSVAEWILFFWHGLWAALVLLLSCCFEHPLPERALECQGMATDLEPGGTPLAILLHRIAWVLEVGTLSIHALAAIDRGHLELLDASMWVHGEVLSHWNAQGFSRIQIIELIKSHRGSLPVEISAPSSNGLVWIWIYHIKVFKYIFLNIWDIVKI